jgi:aminomethyltransferase
VAWIEKHATAFDVTVENLSPSYAEVAIQGPKAQAILQKVTPKNLEEIAFFFFEEEVMVAGYPCLVSRTGYTGEDGFEVYATNEAIEPIVRALMDAGEEEGLVPCGLGARDTLRFEASLPLYGNELSPEITPLEAGLGFFVKLKVDDDFIGKQALVAQKEKGLERKIVGFELNDRGIPRHGYAVVDGEGESIGFVTTGYKSPTLGTTIGLAMVPIEQSEMGSTIHIDIRGKAKEATVVSKRFLKKNYKK